MGLLIIDAAKCKRDGFCVRDCPTTIIRLPEKGVPEIIPGGEAACLECGHCVAVCPHDALSHERIPIAQSPSIREELRINEAQAAQFLRSRRSVHVNHCRALPLHSFGTIKSDVHEFGCSLRSFVTEI